ncbi:MAG: hypothetical protein IK954_02050 [Clostridia bacterium]|nr:hypothetical protein [Clostridia bacterium]
MSKAQITLLSALALLLAAIIAMIAVVATRPEPSTGFTPPPFDAGALVGEPSDIPAELNYQKVKLSEEFAVGLCGNLTATDGCVDLYLTAASQNTVWVRVLLLDESGSEIGSTGLVKPGEYVRSVKLDAVPSQKTTVTAKILSYQPETYYSMGSASAKIILNISE